MSAEDWKLVREHVAGSRLGNAEGALAALDRIEAEASRMADLLIDAETREAMSDAELERLRAEAAS